MANAFVIHKTCAFQYSGRYSADNNIATVIAWDNRQIRTTEITILLSEECIFSEVVGGEAADLASVNKPRNSTIIPRKRVATIYGGSLLEDQRIEPAIQLVGCAIKFDGRGRNDGYF